MIILKGFAFMESYSQYVEIFRKNALDSYADPAFLILFDQFMQIYLVENQKHNLSAIRNLPEAIAKHLADCLLAVPYFPQGASVLDIGCGGGFPTIPLAIARPDLRITGIDSTQKKVYKQI